MYFGDWLRSSDVVKSWYLSYRSEDPDFPNNINELLGRNSQIQKISSTCLLVESTESKKVIVKKLQKYISPSDEVVFLFPHQRMVAYQVLRPAEEED
jgi:hypothetical protein